MSGPQYLLWIDLETTGTDLAQDRILEIGAIVTDFDLNEQEHYHGIVRLAPDEPDALIADPVVRDMHTRNGLLDDCFTSPYAKPLHEHTAPLVELVAPYLNPKITLAGSGVSYFDRRFLDEGFPRLTERLNYWSVDFGVVRRFLRDIAGIEVTGRAPREKRHRALDDLEDHLAEARNIVGYLQMIRRLSTEPDSGQALADIAETLGRISEVLEANVSVTGFRVDTR